ncbi:MAG: LysR family transcriptional regulator [Eubacteriales bacterium]|nr:LysR family transcriptional regulator [Eubacteriales bacterium]
MLDFRILTFLDLCKTHNYTRTAENLFITQPAVSQHIKYLETEYGAKLFYYRDRTLTLTEAGKTLKRCATVMYANCRSIKDKLADCTVTKRQLRFAATLTIGEFVLPPYINRYLLSNSGASVSMLVENTSVILNLLRENAIDFAVVEGYFPQDEFRSRLMQRERYIAVCSPSYPLKREVSRIADLINESLVVREEGSGTREIVERVLEEQNLHFSDFPLINEVGNMNAIKYLVANNRGISFMYESAARAEIDSGVLREIHLLDFNFYREFNFIMLKGSLFSDDFESIFFNDILAGGR